MAESTSDRSDERSEAESSDGGGDRLSARELAEAAKETVADLTGFEPETVTGLEWDGESWLVRVDALELSRIPNTTDVLATYVVQLDDGGVLLGYKRTRRFHRGQVEQE
jgi:hypothetical protein